MSGVHKKIQLAMAELSKIGIEKTRQGDKYSGVGKFRGIDDVYNTLSPILSKVGLIITPKIINFEKFTVAREGNKSSQHMHILIEYTMSDADDGSCIVGSALGEAIDTSDKAAGKAQSYAYKNFVFPALCIPLEAYVDDTDNDDNDYHPETISKDQLNELNSLIDEVGADVSALLAHFKISSLETMPKDLFERVKTALIRKKTNPELSKLKKELA